MLFIAINQPCKGYLPRLVIDTPTKTTMWQWCTGDGDFLPVGGAKVDGNNDRVVWLLCLDPLNVLPLPMLCVPPDNAVIWSNLLLLAHRAISPTTRDIGVRWAWKADWRSTSWQSWWRGTGSDPEVEAEVNCNHHHHHHHWQWPWSRGWNFLDALASLRSIFVTEWLSDNFRLLMFYYCIFQIFY